MKTNGEKTVPAQFEEDTKQKSVVIIEEIRNQDSKDSHSESQSQQSQQLLHDIQSSSPTSHSKSLEIVKDLLKKLHTIKDQYSEFKEQPKIPDSANSIPNSIKNLDTTQKTCETKTRQEEARLGQSIRESQDQKGKQTFELQLEMDVMSTSTQINDSSTQTQDTQAMVNVTPSQQSILLNTVTPAITPHYPSPQVLVSNTPTQQDTLIITPQYPSSQVLASQDPTQLPVQQRILAICKNAFGQEYICEMYPITYTQQQQVNIAQPIYIPEQVNPMQRAYAMQPTNTSQPARLQNAMKPVNIQQSAIQLAEPSQVMQQINLARSFNIRYPMSTLQPTNFIQPTNIRQPFNILQLRNTSPSTFRNAPPAKSNVKAAEFQPQKKEEPLLQQSLSDMKGHSTTSENSGNKPSASSEYYKIQETSRKIFDGSVKLDFNLFKFNIPKKNQTLKGYKQRKCLLNRQRLWMQRKFQRTLPPRKLIRMAYLCAVNDISMKKYLSTKVDTITINKENKIATLPSLSAEPLNISSIDVWGNILKARSLADMDMQFNIPAEPQTIAFPIVERKELGIKAHEQLACLSTEIPEISSTEDEENNSDVEFVQNNPNSDKGDTDIMVWAVTLLNYPKYIKKVQILFKKPKNICAKSLHFKYANPMFKNMGYMIELFNIPQTYSITDLLNIYREEPRYIKRCNETHALLIMGSIEQAKRALLIKHDIVKSRCMVEASPLVNMVACEFELMPAVAEASTAEMMQELILESINSAVKFVLNNPNSDKHDTDIMNWNGTLLNHPKLNKKVQMLFEKKVKVNVQSLHFKDANPMLKNVEYMIELFNIPQTYSITDLLNIYREEPRYIKRCDETHALLIMGSIEQAKRALLINHDIVKSRCMVEASPLVNMIACESELMPAVTEASTAEMMQKLSLEAIDSSIAAEIHDTQKIVTIE